MTEAEWLASSDPVLMLDFLTGPQQYAGGHQIGPPKPSAQKLHQIRDAVWALGFCQLHKAEADLMHLTGCVRDKPNQKFIPAFVHILRDIVGNPFRLVTLPAGEKCPMCKDSPVHGKLSPDGMGLQWLPCAVCRGTGHGPSPVLTPLVRSLAEAAYQERCEDGTLDPDRLLVLSDALIDAGLPAQAGNVAELERDIKTLHLIASGCYSDSAARGYARNINEKSKLLAEARQPHPLLAHLRSEGPHYRGCWAIDLLTGRE